MLSLWQDKLLTSKYLYKFPQELRSGRNSNKMLEILVPQFTNQNIIPPPLPCPTFPLLTFSQNIISPTTHPPPSHPPPTLTESIINKNL